MLKSVMLAAIVALALILAPSRGKAEDNGAKGNLQMYAQMSGCGGGYMNHNMNMSNGTGMMGNGSGMMGNSGNGMMGNYQPNSDYANQNPNDGYQNPNYRYRDPNNPDYGYDRNNYDDGYHR